jgi:hypothetical protein
MNGMINFSLRNWHAVVVAVLTVVVLGTLTLLMIPVDILPPFKSPAVQVLTFYGGMPAINVEKDITNRMERWTGQAAGTSRQESRSIVGAASSETTTAATSTRTALSHKSIPLLRPLFPTCRRAPYRPLSCPSIRRAPRRFASSRSTVKMNRNPFFTTPVGTKSAI